MKRYFYAFRFYSLRNTTTGSPNLKTGRYDIAGETKVFSSLQKRNEWIDQEGKNNSLKELGERIVINGKKHLRKFHRGSTITQFNEMLESLQSECDFQNESSITA